MKMTNGQQCGSAHTERGLVDYAQSMEINGRRYTVCSHKIDLGYGRHTFCGELIDVTDGPVVFCCGGNHEPIGFCD